MIGMETPWDALSRTSGMLNTKAAKGDSSGRWFWVRLSSSSFGIAYRMPKSNPSVESYFKATSEIQFLSVPESNGREYLCILIRSSELATIFHHLCVDLMVACDGFSDSDDILRLISNRVKSWQRLFRRGTRKLNRNQIVGLMAELKFLCDFWLADLERKIDGWVGPLGYPQDFLDEKTNFSVEVKAFSPDRQNVQISSLEQLDFEGNLFLAAYPVSLSQEDGALSLNEFVERCRALIPKELASAFDGRLIEAGYIEDPFYDEEAFLIDEAKLFEIRDDFPCLRSSTIDLAIPKARYELSLNCLVSFRVTKEKILQEVCRG
ncbi:PD-(D/E)XK motif protein [Biformimicrobium ophioploci]|uniref:PD-(D/E)XK motif protein n=1 Tax=Biformimicrobium ophioploci TaxID=3036711 RepID=A0ABQ6LW22_9GAMM|nr:PD-(D/E)XK motif protein [Microbulbifer sp. NKW57]GMG86266.1 hypothetical protein MNKW57_05870 [Microbulbifer sp. NKW57]